MPLGFGIIPIPFIIVLIITIYNIRKSIIKKKIHFLSFSILIYIIIVLIGFWVDIYNTNETKEHLINAKNIIEEYKSNNNTKKLTEDDIKNIDLPDNIYFHIDEYGYTLYYNDGILYEGSGKVNFRPRP